VQARYLAAYIEQRRGCRTLCEQWRVAIRERVDQTDALALDPGAIGFNEPLVWCM
jgi:hypothetical protein